MNLKERAGIMREIDKTLGDLRACGTMTPEQKEAFARKMIENRYREQECEYCGGHHDDPKGACIGCGNIKVKKRLLLEHYTVKNGQRVLDEVLPFS